MLHVYFWWGCREHLKLMISLTESGLDFAGASLVAETHRSSVFVPVRGKTRQHCLRAARTKNISEDFVQKHIFCPGRKICGRHKCSARGKTSQLGKHDHIFRNHPIIFSHHPITSAMLPPRCVLAWPAPYCSGSRKRCALLVGGAWFLPTPAEWWFGLCTISGAPTGWAGSRPSQQSMRLSSFLMSPLKNA